MGVILCQRKRASSPVGPGRWGAALFFALLPAALLTAAPVADAELVHRLERLERRVENGARLALEVQALREELQRAQGRIEELNYALERLRKEQNDRYLALEKGRQRLDSRSAEANGEAPGGRADRVEKTTTARPAERPAAPDISERRAYEQAFSALRANDNARAFVPLRDFIERYPDGLYVGDAWYWIGKAHLIAGRRDEAAAAFAQARPALRRTIERRPDSDDAKRAAERLENIAAIE